MFSSEVYVCLTLVGLHIYVPTSITNYLNLSPYVDYNMVIFLVCLLRWNIQHTNLFFLFSFANL